MLSVDVKDIVQAEVIPWEKGQFGVGYVTKDGKQAADLIGSKSEAEAIVKRVAMNLNTSSDEFGIFPRDIAAS
jgi:hypothetical protein